MADVTIFQLDDDKDQIKLFETLCASEKNFVHRGFTNVKDFLSALKEERPSFCFVDVNLEEGVGAGFVVVEAIRNKYSNDLPIYIVSRRGAAKDIAYAFEIGATDYILKPIDPFLIMEKIKTYSQPKRNSEMPLKEIQNPIKGMLNLDLKLLRLDESYLYAESECFFKKYMSFEMKHDLFGKIFGKKIMDFKVHDCSLDDRTGRYLLQLLAVNNDDEYYRNIYQYLTTGRT